MQGCRWRLGTRIAIFMLRTHFSIKSMGKIFTLAFGLTVTAMPAYGQDSTLLRTDDFSVTKSGKWCSRNAKVTAKAIAAQSQTGLDILASEIKFIFEFECPIANHVDVDVVGPDGGIKPFFISKDTNWKIVEKTLAASAKTMKVSVPGQDYLSVWRPDDLISSSGQARCQNGTLAISSSLINRLSFEQSKRASYNLVQYTTKLAAIDRDYRSSLSQLEAEKANLKYEIESDDRRRTANSGRLFGIKGKRSDAAQSAIKRLNEIGNDDPILQSIIEISFDRMHAIDAFQMQLDAEFAAISRDESGFNKALSLRQNFSQSTDCLRWKPNNSVVIKFVPEIIKDHQDEFFNSVIENIDQALIDRTPFAKGTLLTQIQNIQDVISLEYFWDSYPEYVKTAHKDDPEISAIYTSRLAALKAEAARLQKVAEQNAREERKKKLAAKYNSAYLNVALPAENLPDINSFPTPEEESLIELHEQAQLNSVGHATELSPEICTTRRSQILYGGWASGGTTESTSCSPQVNIGKERQRKLLAQKGPSSTQLYSTCSKELKKEFCKCLSGKNTGHFTSEEYNLFSESPKAYIAFIKERGFVRYTRGFSDTTNFSSSEGISDFMESGAIDSLMEVGAERMGNIFTGLAALMQGNVDSAINKFREAQLMVPSNAGDLTTFCVAANQS